MGQSCNNFSDLYCCMYEPIVVFWHIVTAYYCIGIRNPYCVIELT